MDRFLRCIRHDQVTLNRQGIDMEFRELNEDEIKEVSGGLTFAQGLGMGSFALGVAGQVARFVPGAQVLSAGLSVLSIGVGALAGAAAAADI